MNNLPLRGFVDGIGRSLVAEVGPTPFEFKFYVVKSQEPNAFAIPGGYVFVTTGLLVTAENEQEVAGRPQSRNCPCHDEAYLPID